VKIKVLPPAPHPDDVTPAPLEKVLGPCQIHCANFKSARAAEAAGIAPLVVEDEPYVDERMKALMAERQRYRDLKAQGKLPKRKRAPT
jgi:hypothetical protein